MSFLHPDHLTPIPDLGLTKSKQTKPPKTSLGLSLVGPLVLTESSWDQPIAFICLKEQPCHLSLIVFLYFLGEKLPCSLKTQSESRNLRKWARATRQD